MAKLRSRLSRDRKTGELRPYYSIRLKDHSEIGVGTDEHVAGLLLAEYTLREEFERRGVKLPTRSPWTLEDLRDYDVKVAGDEGGETASRGRRWEILLLELGPETPIEDLSPAVIQRFIDRRLESKASPRTINRDLSVLRKALRRAREARSGSMFAGDPFLGIPQLKEGDKKKPVPRSREEIDALIAEAYRLAANGPAYALPGELLQNAQMFELLYLTGSRKSQIMRLRRDQVIEHPIAGPLLRFPKHKRGKDRLFYYRGRLKAILESIPDDGSGWFFSSKRALGQPRAEFGKALFTAAKNAKVPRLTAHVLRHSLSSAFLAAGVSISKVQSKLGHRSRRTTEEEYAELFPEILKAERPPNPRRLPGRAAKRRPAARRGKTAAL